MKMEFVSRQATFLMGMSFYGDPFKDAGDWSESNEIGRLCRRYMDYATKNRNALLPMTVKDDFYEVHIYGEESPARGFLEVFVGQETRELNSLPLELSLKVLPAGQFSKVDLAGQAIISDWYKDLDGRLAREGWQRGLPFFFQVYDQRYKGIERIAESELTAYIPVKPILK